MTDAKHQPHFRSAATQTRLAEAVYRDAFDGAPHPYLILSPSLRIEGANDAYLSATMRRRDGLISIDMFDAFPDNPHDDAASGVGNLSASLERVLISGRHDVMPLQRYDIKGPDGVWEVRYWNPVNWPVLDDAGSIIAIVHHVTDVTPQILEARPRQRPSLDELLLRARTARDLIEQSRQSIRVSRETVADTKRVLEESRRLLEGPVAGIERKRLDTDK